MRHRVLILATLAAAAGACAPVPKGNADAPLTARLAVTASGVDVGLSDQAHVAVFAVSPGYGMSLVYPQLHERSRFFAGWSPMVHGSEPQRGSLALPARFASGRGTQVLVLVASREPLDVRRYAAGGSPALETALGTAAYRAHDADAVVDGLVNLLAAGRDESDVAVDVVVIPSGGGPAGALAYEGGRFPFEQPYVVVYCSAPGTPSRVVVHVEFARYACVPQDPPAEADTTHAGDTGRRSADLIPARRNEPAPVGAARVAPAGGGPAVHREPAGGASDPRARERSGRPSEPSAPPKSDTAGRRAPEHSPGGAVRERVPAGPARRTP